MLTPPKTFPVLFRWGTGVTQPPPNGNEKSDMNNDQSYLENMIQFQFSPEAKPESQYIGGAQCREPSCERVTGLKNKVVYRIDRLKLIINISLRTEQFP